MTPAQWAAPRFAPSASQTGFAAGLLLCAGLAAAAIAIGRLAPVPPVLTALLLGMAARRLPIGRSALPGVGFCGRNLLRIGVALLGARLSVDQLAALGWPAAIVAAGAVIVTIMLGGLAGRLCGLAPERALLSAGSVGICGASAALAISSVLPPSPARERETVFTIAAVTTFSTAVMLLYPLIARLAGFDASQAGIFLGASIHDITQVIGAGALVSPEATVSATATKLVRVACLAPAVALIALSTARNCAGTMTRPPLLPPFLVGFVVMAGAANSGWLPHGAITLFSETATIFLVTATAALGLKTSIRDLAGAGWRPLAAVTAQTAIIGLYSLGAVWLFIAPTH
jgi:uncharacterized integral membrane protein (TIGR00698 family)